MHPVGFGLAASVGSPWLSGCYGEDVYEPTGVYDAIVVGGGSAGAIVAAKLQIASGGRKRILVIEAGGPTAAAIGGSDRPPWLPPDRDDLTIFDVPGEYSQIAFMPLGAPYQLTETPFTFQGIGLGGNSMFNGMLFQTNPPAIFDRRWPAGWHWDDMRPYFERVRQHVPVTNTPSTDGVPQNTGPASIVHPLYASRRLGRSRHQPAIRRRRASIAGPTSRPSTAAALDRSAATSKRSIRTAHRRQVSRSCSTPRPSASSSMERRGAARCTTRSAAAWTRRSPERRAPPGCAPADCWSWPPARS